MTAVLVALAAAGAAVWFGYDRYQHRFVSGDSDLVKLLPPGDVTTFFVDLAKLRQAGLLHLLTGVTPAATDRDYADFVAATGFDYTRDMDALAGAVNDDSETFFLIRGRFDWGRIQKFSEAHGGTCDPEGCRGPGSKPQRWVNFIRIQPDVVGLAIGHSSRQADLLRPPGRRVQEAPIGQPVWVRVSHSLLKDPTVLASPLRIFAISMQGADTVLLSVGKPERGDEAFLVEMDATFPDAPSADTACKQLVIQTRLLRGELAHENKEPNPADLTGMMTAGKFEVGSTRVFGSWPVRKELLAALE